MHNVRWPDAALEALDIGYDLVDIKVREPDGRMSKLTCHGYIGYEAIGIWDECVIESARIQQHSPIC